MGRSYGNIGNAYNALGYYEQAIKYHKQELTISKEVNCLRYAMKNKFNNKFMLQNIIKIVI